MPAAKMGARAAEEPLARGVRHGTTPAHSLVRRHGWSSGSIVIRRTGGGRAVALGVAVQAVVSTVLVPDLAEAKGRHDEHIDAGPRVTEPTEPRRSLCASPCSLAGIAQASVRDGTRKSDAENELWGRPNSGRKQIGSNVKAQGNPDELDAHGLFPAVRVGAPHSTSAEGNRLYTEGNFEGARLKFLQALAVARTPSLLFNLARSEEKTGKLAEAYLHYQEYLKFPNLPAKGKGDAEKYTAELEKRVGRIQIDAPTGSHVQVDGKDVGAAPFAGPIAVEAGPHQVMLGTETKPVSCAAGTVVTVTFETKPSVGVVPPEKGPGPITPPPKEEMVTGSWVVPGILAGVGVVGVGVGVGLAAASSGAEWRRTGHR